MVFILGIDEAGYGPLLGPLVVASTLWEADAPEADGWERLAAAVSQKADRTAARLHVADSKEVFDRKRGPSVLERSVLAFTRAAGHQISNAAELLQEVADWSHCRSALPWYAELASLPLPLDPHGSAYEGIAQRLASTMAAAHYRCVGLHAAVMPEDHYNQRVEQTGNKAAILLESVLRLIDQAGRRAGATPLYIHVDRLGGRSDYRRVLMQAFPEHHLAVLATGDACSAYRLTCGTAAWTIDFSVGGENHHLPIALASMLAKYLRELLMTRFNAYWNQHLPELRSTAGYYTDGMRFIAEIRTLAAATGLPVERFVRLR